MATGAGAAGTAAAGAGEGAGTADDGTEGSRKRGGILGKLLALLALIGAGGGAFWGVSAGHVPPPVATVSAMLAAPPPKPWDGWQPPDFVDLPPITVSLGPEASARHLRTLLVIEVAPGASEAVRAAEPRIIATLVRFLRAVDERDFEQPALMLRLQAQMRRRVQLVTPPESVQDVLVQEFLLN
ncbi:MAG: flagellar basal body-associated FliL family protein [Pseudomonadota bacterium]